MTMSGSQDGAAPEQGQRQTQRRVAAIHDISCIGRCSLTVALPIISAAGVECACIPTAVLSTHTGGFTGYTYHDLTNQIAPIAAHWKSLGLGFDALYSGYLGSFEQLALMEGLIDTFRSDGTIVFIDPVMADNGVLYKGFTTEFAQGMAKLCGRADVIVPNMTEATLMLGEPYVEGPYTEEYVNGLLRRLAALGPRMVILTGVYYDENRLGAACYDAVRDEFDVALSERVEGYYHGTGDVFGSAALAAMMNGRTLAEAAHIAVDFTVACIARTHRAQIDVKYGVRFEEELPTLMRLIGRI